MQITDVKVRKLFHEGPMKAIVSVTFDGQLAVHDIKIINARDKFFIVMPSRNTANSTSRHLNKYFNFAKYSLMFTPPCTIYLLHSSTISAKIQ